MFEGYFWEKVLKEFQFLLKPKFLKYDAQIIL